jgi:FixJ family two-component response regulator
MSAVTATCVLRADRHHSRCEDVRAAQTVFVVDDAEETRAELTRLLGAAGYHVRVFESAERFFEEHDSEAPGCLLLENCMPEMSGLEAQRLLNRSEITRPIIFLTGHGDIQTSVQAMKQGAVDFLTKPIDEVHLLAAIDQALQLDLAARHKRAICLNMEQRLGTLTPRQREIMDQIVRGRTNKQIALDLGIVEKTVKIHRARVMLKMKVRTVPELVRIAIRVGVPTRLTFDGGELRAGELTTSLRMIHSRSAGDRHGQVHPAEHT